MDEAFSDKIEKIQEADEDTEDYAMGSNVESDNGDGFQDTVWQIMVSGFPIILRVASPFDGDLNLIFMLI